MTRADALRCLRERESDLRALGIERLSLFGSTARDDGGPGSDVDLAAVVDYDAIGRLGPFGFFGIADRISDMLGARVDLVTEPARKARFQAEIDRDRVSVF